MGAFIDGNAKHYVILQDQGVNPKFSTLSTLYSLYFVTNRQLFGSVAERETENCYSVGKWGQKMHKKCRSLCEDECHECCPIPKPVILCRQLLQSSLSSIQFSLSSHLFEKNSEKCFPVFLSLISNVKSYQKSWQSMCTIGHRISRPLS